MDGDDNTDAFGRIVATRKITSLDDDIHGDERMNNDAMMDERNEPRQSRWGTGDRYDNDHRRYDDGGRGFGGRGYGGRGRGRFRGGPPHFDNRDRRPFMGEHDNRHRQQDYDYGMNSRSNMPYDGMDDHKRGREEWGHDDPRDKRNRFERFDDRRNDGYPNEAPRRESHENFRNDRFERGRGNYFGRGWGGRGRGGDYGAKDNQMGYSYDNRERDNWHDNNHRNPPKMKSAMSPMLSFKSFTQTLSDEFNPELYQSKYDEYVTDYLNKFANIFYDNNINKEWFQDRYNPVNIIELEQANINWAHNESKLFKEQVLENPMEAMKAMCLDPQYNKNKSIRDMNNRHNKFRSYDNDDNSNNDEDNEETNKQSILHLSGHTNRTIYITGIHASCPKSVFKSSIISKLQNLPVKEDEGDESLSNNGAETSASGLVPDRIFIAQPMWNNRNIEQFERVAWVVMKSPEDTEKAIEVLRNLEISVPGAVDEETGVSNPHDTFYFKINACAHTPRRPIISNHEFLCYGSRVEADTIRAVELSELLDAERNVPEESRLNTIIQKKSVQDVMVKPTDKLDFIIAYLCRVHFVNFYTGKRFKDEADMLLCASSVVLRSGNYIPTNDQPEATTIPANNAITSYDKTDQSADEGEVDEDNEPGEIEEADNDNNLTTKQGKFDISTSSTVNGKVVPLTNIRIEVMIEDLRKRAAKRDDKISDNNASVSQNEDDAQEIIEKHEQVLEDIIQDKCKFEKEGKCRCCYAYCNKLFKGRDFLRKHMKAKHPYFGSSAFTKISEPYMRKRFDAEDMILRPLPPVEMETRGMFELRTVKEILERQRAFASGRGGSGRGGGRGSGGYQQRGFKRRFDDFGGGDDGFKRRGFDDRDRRGSGGGMYPQDVHNDQYPRKMSNYLDVDAPKESMVNIDYGVALMPPIKKKRKPLM